MSLRTDSLASFAARPVSQRNMEALSQRYLHAAFPENLRTPTTLNVAALLDKLEYIVDVEYEVNDLPQGDEGYTDPSNRVIYLAEDVYTAMIKGDGRARQTCCHEIGHIQHIGQVNRMLRDGGSRLARQLNVQVQTCENPEWQAHALGQALLMPATTTPGVYAKGGLVALEATFVVSGANATSRVRALQRLGLIPAGRIRML